MAINPQGGAAIVPTINRKRILAAFTRPANTDAYTIGDVVGPVTTPAAQAFAGAARYNGGTGKIVGITIECNLATVTLGTFRAHVFNTAIVPAADNAVFAGIHGGVAGYQGFCDPPILVNDASGSGAAVTRLNAGVDAAKGLPMGFQCAPGDTGLYVVLVALAAYVPSSGEVFNVWLEIEQD